MTLPVTTRLSGAMFDALVSSPEFRDRHMELIDGELVEKMVAGRKSSLISSVIVGFVSTFVAQHQLGETTDAQGGYQVGEDRYIPDGAFVRKERLPVAEVEGYSVIAPDLAIEVISSTDRTTAVASKVAMYMRHGTTLWLVDPIEQTVTVYVPNMHEVTYLKHQTLLGGEVLPRFELPLSAVFGE
jgi:Uma2 family endonuclease